MAAILVGLVLVGCVPAKARTFARREVVIRGMRFEPARIQAQVGDTLIWRNRDLVPHTATAAGGAFDSGAIAPDSEWVWIAARSGEVMYGCLFHPTMKARCQIQP
jgi:plastocyanin